MSEGTEEVDCRPRLVEAEPGASPEVALSSLGCVEAGSVVGDDG
jgi:hypothetical protein